MTDFANLTSKLGCPQGQPMTDFANLTSKLGCPHKIIGPCLLINGDCREVLPHVEANSIGLIATDPPYFRVKGDAWDRQWDDAGKFIEWIGQLCGEWHRTTKANGSLYVFASPKMAARVECKIGERFNVLNSITWAKPGQSYAKKYGPENFRQFVPMCERVIFAEHYGADNIAKGEAGYGARCDELRGFVFEPLRAYLAGERDRAGFTTRRVAEAFQIKTGSRTVTGMAGHWFESIQWTLPTQENYEWLRSLFSGDYLRREYEDLRREYEDLRREYEDLRREYEDLRRPFSVTAEVPFTDVWTYQTVRAYKGKHPCEKPIEMMEHIITASSRPGDLVMDCFAGSGTTGVACVRQGRRFIGIELDARYYRLACDRIARQLDENQGGPMFAIIQQHGGTDAG